MTNENKINPQMSPLIPLKGRDVPEGWWIILTQYINIATIKLISRLECNKINFPSMYRHKKAK